MHLQEILRRGVERGHEVTWLSSGYEGAAEEERGADGIRYRRRGAWQTFNFSLQA